MNNNNEFRTNEKLKELVDERGIKWMWLSQKAGISYKTLNAVKKSRVKIKFDDLAKICEVLDIPLNFFKDNV